MGDGGLLGMGWLPRVTFGVSVPHDHKHEGVLYMPGGLTFNVNIRFNVTV